MYYSVMLVAPNSDRKSTIENQDAGVVEAAFEATVGCWATSASS